MKKLFLIALLLCSGAASAEVVAVSQNGGGGYIELSDALTPEELAKHYPICRGRYIAKTWSHTSEDLYGCWEISRSTPTILVYWVKNGVNRTYDATLFQTTEYFETEYGR